MSISPTRSLALVLAASLLAACSGTPTKTDGAGTDAAAVDSRDGAAGAATMGVGGQGAWTGSPLDDPSSPLSSRTIYFELDSSDIPPESVDVLRAHAQYLASNPSVRVTLEGHCDERGTREYNLALGERRARTVRQFVLAEGVSGGQIDTISYGEERPVDLTPGEAGWARNRRVEIVY
jgi:peptidoglycan-associated lipoprotein